MAFLRSLIHGHKYLSVCPRISPKILVSAFSPNVAGHRFLNSEINPRVEARLKRKDGIQEDFRIIYRAPYEYYCKSAYVICIISTTVFPVMFSSLIFTHGLGNFPYMIGDSVVVNSPWELAAFAVGLAVLIGNLSLVVFRYPYRMYRQKDEYILVYQHILPWKYDKEVLIAGELERDDDAFFSWNKSLYRFRNRGAIILEDQFKIPSDFNDMLSIEDKKRKP